MTANAETDAGTYVRPAPTVLDQDLWFEDFEAGRVFVSRPHTLTEDEIVAFGRSYANLPYHTDPEAARDTMFGELVAPGYMTAALSFGLFVDIGVLRACGMGSPGVDKLRWHRPVRPGDTLHVEAEVAEVSPAAEPKGRNAIRMAYTTVNQRGEPVMTLSSLHFVRPRPTD